MRLFLSAVACALPLMFAPGSALAQQTNAPPGNAGIDEYLEAVPAAGGAKPVTPDRGGNTGIGSETRGQLEQLGGQDGKLAADLAAAGTPAERSRSGDGSGSGTGGVSRLPDESAESPIKAVVEAVTGGATEDGMGPLLPILLLLGLTGMVAVAVARRASE